MAAPRWLVARPIAHRGWHAAERGVVENTRGSAKAAIGRGFAIECDVQLSRDGEAVVFHDTTLDRLTEAEGPVAARALAELQKVRFKGCGEAMPTLSELLAVIGGAVPLICELKSHFDGDFRLAERVAAIAKLYSGPLALKSFDPEVVAYLRASGSDRPLGVVAEASYDDPYFDEMNAAQKQRAAAFLHINETRPDFLSWSVADLPHPTPTLCRALGGMPVIAWTVRTRDDRARAKRYADQILFEGEPEGSPEARAPAEVGA